MEWYEDNVAEFVAECPNCQQVKAEHHRPSGLAQHVDNPVWKWEMINIGFVSGLPRSSRRHDLIWVIVDRLTKSAQFLPVKTTDWTEDYAKSYVNEIAILYGTLVSIISDYGA